MPAITFYKHEPIPMEMHKVKIVQQLHLLRDCRLGYIKLLGGLCEAAAFGGRNEVFKLISVHHMPQNKFFLF